MTKFSPTFIKEAINGIFKLAIAVLAIFVSISTFKTIIHDEVNDFSTDDQFLRSLASQINPFLIFDSNESYLYDGGAQKYIDDIKVNTGKHSKYGNRIAPIEIIITTNKVFTYEPQLSCLDAGGERLTKVKRGKKTSWIFNLENWLSSSSGEIDTFRIDILP
jgi:hypothetical protein